MYTTSAAAAFLLASSSTLAAQIKVETLQRVTTQVVYRNSEPRVSYSINYGSLTWRDEYGRELDGEYGVDFRLGSGAWAELNTNAALSMGATKVAAGRYYLAIRRLLPQAWELMLMHADPLDRRRLDARFTGQVKPDITVPLQFARLSAAVPELKVEFLPDPDAIGRATLQIRFGSHQVETPVVAELHERPRTPTPKFEALDPVASKTTASGLVYEVVRPGKGESPKAGDVVVAYYTGWLADGTQFDSSHDGEPTSMLLDNLFAGWQEGFQLMTPGSVYKLSIPPGLGYGARQMGQIPANSTLVFRVELIEVLR
jgi:hypothetical protein